MRMGNVWTHSDGSLTERSLKEIYSEYATDLHLFASSHQITISQTPPTIVGGNRDFMEAMGNPKALMARIKSEFAISDRAYP